MILRPIILFTVFMATCTVPECFAGEGEPQVIPARTSEGPSFGFSFGGDYHFTNFDFDGQRSLSTTLQDGLYDESPVLGSFNTNSATGIRAMAHYMPHFGQDSNTPSLILGAGIETYSGKIIKNDLVNAKIHMAFLGLELGVFKKMGELSSTEVLLGYGSPLFGEAEFAYVNRVAEGYKEMGRVVDHINGGKKISILGRYNISPFIDGIQIGLGLGAYYGSLKFKERSGGGANFSGTMLQLLFNFVL